MELFALHGATCTKSGPMTKSRRIDPTFCQVPHQKGESLALLQNGIRQPLRLWVRLGNTFRQGPLDREQLEARRPGPQRALEDEEGGPERPQVHAFRTRQDKPLLMCLCWCLGGGCKALLQGLLTLGEGLQLGCQQRQGLRNSHNLRRQLRSSDPLCPGRRLRSAGRWLLRGTVKG